MKKILVIFIITFTLFSCNKNTTNNNQLNKKTQNETTKIKVITSIIPLASIANYIGWEYVEANSLVPAWISPHSFDLKPNQMVDLEKSDLIVYLGLEHIDWFLNKPIENKNNILSVAKNIKLIEYEAHEHKDEEHYDEGEEIHENEDEEDESHSIDPHIWSSSENSYIIAKSILNKLSMISPENEDYFNANFEWFKNELEIAKKEFKENIKDKKQNNFIVFHDAYNYLFKEIEIDNSKKHIFRTNILSDPNSKEMKEFIDEIKEEGINIAFKEPQVDSSNLNSLSSEHSLEIFILDPLWEDESKSWYIDNYKNNLKNLEYIYE